MFVLVTGFTIPTRSEEREVLGVGSIYFAILPSWQYNLLHHNCDKMKGYYTDRRPMGLLVSIIA